MAANNGLDLKKPTDALNFLKMILQSEAIRLNGKEYTHAFICIETLKTEISGKELSKNETESEGVSDFKP